MKKLVWIFVVLFFAACGQTETRYTAQGGPYELIVVADHAEWDGPVGDTLRGMFYRQFPMINRQETMFNLFRVLPEGFTKFVPRHRNILLVRIDPSVAGPQLGMSENVYAEPQVVISATAPDEASMLSLLAERGEDIMLVLESAEKDRDVADAVGHTPPAIAELIKAKFGIELSMGPAYTVRQDGDDFLWLSYELPAASQGIVIYSYPFEGSPDMQLNSLLRRRNEFVARIPGENPGSFMTTNPDYTSLVYKTIEGRQWAELHGFWDVEGDFMGGPFTNYSTFDIASGRILSIDFYVYSPDPRLSQRNYIKQLEHYIYTVGFPR